MKTLDLKKITFFIYSNIKENEKVIFEPFKKRSFRKKQNKKMSENAKDSHIVDIKI